MTAIQLIGITPEQLKEAIILDIRNDINDLKESFQPKEPEQYLTRKQVCEMLQVDMSTLHNWKHKGILIPVGIGGRVLYKRSDIESRLVDLG